MVWITGMLGLLIGVLLSALYARHALQGVRRELEGWRAKRESALLERTKFESEATRVHALEALFNCQSGGNHDTDHFEQPEEATLRRRHWCSAASLAHFAVRLITNSLAPEQRAAQVERVGVAGVGDLGGDVGLHLHAHRPFPSFGAGKYSSSRLA